MGLISWKKETIFYSLTSNSKWSVELKSSIKNGKERTLYLSGLEVKLLDLSVCFIKGPGLALEDVESVSYN